MTQEEKRHLHHFLAEWKDIFDHKSHRASEETAARIRALFHPTNFAFYSPVVHTPYKDIDSVMAILRWIIEVLQDFRYTQTTTGNDNEGNPLIVLFFTAAVSPLNESEKKLQVEGADFFKLDRKSGKVSNPFSPSFSPLTSL